MKKKYALLLIFSLLRGDKDIIFRVVRLTAISVNRNRNGLKNGDPQELWDPCG